MSIKAKIRLSEFEIELVNNTEWILTKQSILHKVHLLFGEILETYKSILINDQNFLYAVGETNNGKISKGENYLGLPYLMLDYPGFFRREKIFAIRTMFWWGNFFSITLHVSGESMLRNISVSNILNSIRDLDFFVCVGENEWQHTFDPSNYVLVKSIGEQQYAAICSKHFFKISKKIEINKWNEIPLFFKKSFKEIIELIKSNYHWPTETVCGEKNPEV